MASNRIIISLVIAGALASSASTAAFAGDHRNHFSGNGTAIAVGIIGAVVVGSLLANAQPAPQPYYQPQPQPQPQAYYYPPQPVQQVYYEAPQQYYQPQPVAYVGRGYRERHEYRRYHHRPDGYYSR